MVTNNEPIEPSDILFKETYPLVIRLIVACVLTFTMVWELTGYFLEGRPSGTTFGLVVTVGICAVLTCIALFQEDLRWIIRAGELQIREDWITGHSETKLVRTGDVAKIKVVDDSDEERFAFYIRIWLANGEQIRSPSLGDSKRANELVDQIMQRLQVPPHHRAATNYRRIVE